MAYFGTEMQGRTAINNTYMRIAEIITAVTKTPDQLRVDSFKSGAERAAKSGEG